jgi:hypothetical protein
MNNKITEPPEKKNSSTSKIVLALVLAFVPAIILLATSPDFFRRNPMPLVAGVFLVSVGCCFTSSFLLFRHKSTWAIVVGILFLLLNLLISFCLGCLTLFNNHF